MKKIPLTKGQFTIVDDEDFEYLNQWKWFASKDARNFRPKRHRRTREDPKRTPIYMHQQIMGIKKGYEIDHINGDPLDNRRCNLRHCTRSQNRMNSKSNSGSSSKYKGVSWGAAEKKWIANIRINGKSIRLGAFRSEKEASLAYDKKAIEFFGEFALTNFPQTPCT